MITLHYADYFVFGVLLFLSAMVGPFYMWRDRDKPATSESYFVANRGLHFLPTAASLFASFYSAIGIIGAPAELYTGGAKFFMSIFGQMIGITIGAFFAVPMIYKLQLISSYEYLEMRFKSSALRKLGTVSNVLTTAFWLAVVTYAPCIALEAVSPIPVWASVTVTVAVTVIYTVLGGIKAVVLVDLIQALVMFGGVIVAIVIGYMKIEGGFLRAMEVARAGGRLDFFDLNPDLTNTYNFWIMVIPPIFANAGVYATSQAAVQRYSALPTVKQATWSILAMAPQMFFLQLLLFLLALAMFVHYDIQGCDPLRGGLISTQNQLTTFYVADILHYPGLVGVWFAALFSGSLSTMSTGYNSVAACIWEDFLKNSLQKKLSPRKISFLLKFITLLLGMITCFIAVFLKHLTGSIIKITSSTVNIFGAGIYIAFFGGALCPFINAFGSVIGMIFSTLLIAIIAAGQMYYKLGNEQVWLPTKTDNCTAMMATMIASGKWQPSPQQMKKFGNVTKAVTASLMLLTTPAASVVANNIAPPNSTSPILSDNFLPSVIAADDVFMKSSGNGAATTIFGLTTFDDSNKNETLVQPWMTLPKPLLYLFSVSYFIFPFLALLAGVVIALVISLCTGGLDLAKTVHPGLMVVKNCFYKGESNEEVTYSWYYGKGSSAPGTPATKEPIRRIVYEDTAEFAAAHNVKIVAEKEQPAVEYEFRLSPEPPATTSDEDYVDGEIYANISEIRKSISDRAANNTKTYVDNPLYWRPEMKPLVPGATLLKR